MDKKSIWEIMLTPLVVAVVGVVGTILVTDSQIESSNNLARAQQKIKMIEIFSDKITRKDEAERALAIKVLAAVDPELGETIASAIADTELDVTREIDGMKSSLALEVKAGIEKEERDTERDTGIDNEKYLVGVYALNVNSDQFSELMGSLNESGYTIVTDTLLPSRPKWLAQNSTVLYYSSESKETAEKIAEQLSDVSGTNFNIQRGAGLGVPKGQAATRLFIHYVM